MKTILNVSLLLCSLVTQQAFCTTPQNGKVVWWGKDCFFTERHSHTNGLVESGGEFLTNAISIAANWGTGFAARADGTVCSFGWDLRGRKNIPGGLSNVVSVVAERGTCWAIKRDGTVAQWGEGSVVTGLTNITAITWARNENFLALRSDGTVVGFGVSIFGPRPKPGPVVVGGKMLSNVAAIASGPLILKTDGTVRRLEGMDVNDPCQCASESLLTANGEPLSNILAIAGSELHALALRSNHTVVAWGDNSYGQTSVPTGLTNVIAIAADHPLSLALKSDGTVAAWGGNYDGQSSSYPKGLSNVVAIAAGSMFGLALTTGNVPSSVYLEPHGRLEEMAALSDLVFKGKALSSERVTNAAFRISSMEVFKTRFEVISVLKGTTHKTVDFLHYGGWGPGGFAWSGPSPPAAHRFEPGQSYLVLAANLDRADSYYAPTPGTVSQPDAFRQIADIPRAPDDGVIRTLDGRSLDNLSARYSWMLRSIEEWRHPTLLVKEAHWFELNLLLTNSASSNCLYALEKLDQMSLAGRSDDRWRHSDDFKRPAVLAALLPLVTNAEEKIANRALACFGYEPSHPAQLGPFAQALIEVANHGSTASRRLNAIGALSGTHFGAVSNSLLQLLSDQEAGTRAAAVGSLAAYPGPFSEQALRHAAQDPSPRVRATVAEAIGTGKTESLLPILQMLFSPPIGQTNPVAEVHTAAGSALLAFDVKQVAEILKANLNDEEFRPTFLCKLAEGGTGPWLTNLVEVLEARRIRVRQEVDSSGVEPKASYLRARMALAGTPFQCWNLIYNYLHELPPAAFADGKMSRCLDALEKAGTTGSREPTMLYELYRMKGLNQRASQFRSENDNRAVGYDLGQYFDRVDAQYPPKARN